MKFTRKTLGAVSAAAALGLAALGMATPADAATRQTAVVVESNAFTSLNSSTPDTNLTINSDVSYLTGIGFAYYDNQPKLIRNTTFGTFKIVKNTKTDFRVKYTVKPGRLWSDGTPINAVDLLLSHVLSSSAYSKAAGLGDPSSEDTAPKFNSLGYNGPYDSHIVGEPELSSDKMSVTLRYDAFQPDWEIMGPGPSPVHALVRLAKGETTLGKVVANEASREAFLKSFNSKNADGLLTKMANVWSNDYNISTINSSTNPNLLVGNGAYLVKNAVTDQSVTLKANPKYNSGPALSGIQTIVLRTIGDGTAAAQALSNKEIDIYQGQPTADSVAQLKAMSGVTVKGGAQFIYEHVDLRVDAVPGSGETYTGPWKGLSQKSKDLRKAFLLAYPREAIVNTLVKPINSSAKVLGSSFLLPGMAGYDTVSAKSGVGAYNAGTQADRTKAALALVKKYYPSASASNPVVKVKMLWGSLANQRRVAEFALAVAAVKKAGFELTNPSYTGGWSGHLDEAKYDAQFFAWVLTSISQTGTNANFQSDGGNNHLGYNNPAMDKVLKKLETYLTPAQVLAQYTAGDKLLAQDAVTLPIFQHPGVTAFNSALKNVKPAPLSPNLVWNYWQWHW